MVDPGTVALAKSTIDIVGKFFDKHPISDADETHLDYSTGVTRHLAESLSWASRVQFFGMSSAEETNVSTIPLKISNQQRRFRGAGEIIGNEETLLSIQDNIILLGDPGSGKTTSLKRLVRHLIIEEPAQDLDAYAFPIVVRLRELPSNRTITEAILLSFGLSLERRQMLHDERTSGLSTYETWVGKKRANEYVHDLMQNIPILFIFDGLDEATCDPLSIRKELSWFGHNSGQSKIIVTCRSGDYHGVIDGYSVMEICPLSREEIEVIATRSLGSSASFLQALDSAPYKDIADRPLFLAQLIFIFSRYGYLPQLPFEIYRSIVTLLLKEWDAERGIRRLSKYAEFNPDRKLSFLAALSYQLTYRIKCKRFSIKELTDAYSAICERFSLPRSELLEVVGEVESHSGIIVAAGYGYFEFSHLSIQEYLCAEYLSRETNQDRLIDYLVQYPAPVAICIAISSDPSFTFASLVLRNKTLSADSLESLISRILLELPPFYPSPALGISILRLLDISTEITYKRIQPLIMDMFRIPGVSKSLSLALTYYSQTALCDHAASTKLVRVKSLDHCKALKTPQSIHLSDYVMKDIMFICSADNSL